ncbi:MAG: hypothetical protein GEV03_24575 [Streptosporangiales bacterium]|nr:hypothetical protein [Streptosporangiales bacterium]
MRAPVVDQHASWIAVNPIQGCPKGCLYCFLNERGQTRVRPEELTTPAETARMLLTSPWYAPGRAVALFTWTDVMAVAGSRAYLAELLAELTATKLPNPVVLITKCRIPPDTIEQITAARNGGLRAIVYLSYSGLDEEVERGIRHEHTVGNFRVLAEAGIPIVHYWRPAFPRSATTETMTAVLDLAARYARCTMAAGLKVEADAVARLAQLWPALATHPGVTEAEGVYPAAFWDFIHHTAHRHPDYPVFHTNSCALAYVLAEPDRFGVFGGPVCRLRNHCPPAQRARCAADAARPTPSEEAVAAALTRRGLPGVAFTRQADGRELVVHAAVANRTVSALTQDLGVRVRVTGQGDDAYWSSGTCGARPLVIDDAEGDVP